MCDCLTPSDQLSTYIMARTSFPDGAVCFVLDQHVELNFYEPHKFCPLYFILFKLSAVCFRILLKSGRLKSTGIGEISLSFKHNYVDQWFDETN